MTRSTLPGAAAQPSICFPNEDVARALEYFWSRDKVVGAICHGAIALGNIPNRIRGRRVTGYTLEGDQQLQAMFGSGFVIPHYPQTVLEETGALYKRVGANDPCVVVDGKLVTGQNQQSASEYALALLHVMAGQSPYRARKSAIPYRRSRMLFHVYINVRIPHDVDPEQLKMLGAQEHERAKVLQEQRKWLHLWRVAGKFANVSIFDVESPAELHEILNSLPLYPFMEVEVTALCRHPGALELHDKRSTVFEPHRRCSRPQQGRDSMLFYMQMRWNIEGRLSFKEVWDLEIEESEAAKADFKILGMYKLQVRDA